MLTIFKHQNSFVERNWIHCTESLRKFWRKILAWQRSRLSYLPNLVFHYSQQHLNFQIKQYNYNILSFLCFINKLIRKVKFGTPYFLNKCPNFWQICILNIFHISIFLLNDWFKLKCSFHIDLNNMVFKIYKECLLHLYLIKTCFTLFMCNISIKYSIRLTEFLIAFVLCVDRIYFFIHISS